MVLYNNQRDRHNLLRNALVQPSQSGWQHLLNFGDDNSFLTMTGLSRFAFMELEKVLFPPSEARPRSNGGRPQSLDNRDQLGLYLFYTGSKMTAKFLCIIFGVTPSACSRFVLKVMVLANSRRLQRDPRARIKFPDPETQEIGAERQLQWVPWGYYVQ